MHTARSRLTNETTASLHIFFSWFLCIQYNTTIGYISLTQYRLSSCLVVTECTSSLYSSRFVSRHFRSIQHTRVCGHGQGWCNISRANLLHVAKGYSGDHGGYRVIRSLRIILTSIEDSTAQKRNHGSCACNTANLPMFTILYISH